VVGFVTGPEQRRCSSASGTHAGPPYADARTLRSVRDDAGHLSPTPLVVAAGLAAVEGILVIGFAALEAASVHADRAAMGVTTSVFFALLGALLVACAWYVVRGRTWARSPLVVSQLMALGLAWNFLGGGTTWVSVVLTVVAVVVLVGLLHPASVEALAHHGDEA